MSKYETLLDAATKLLEAIQAMAPSDLADEMTQRYGETMRICDVTHALNVSRVSIYRMIEDGRLETACEGKRIQTRSVARYIDNRDSINHQTRMQKKYGNHKPGAGAASTV